MTNVLAIGAHPDDIELGCAGTLVKHVMRGDDVSILVISDGEAGPGDTHLRIREMEAAAELIGATKVYRGHMPDGRVSNHELSLVHLIESVMREIGANIVYSHGVGDSHQDHRAVALATWGACRHAEQVLCYDSPSSVGFQPTVFVDITDSLEKKVAALEAHVSQVAHSRMANVEMVRAKAITLGFSARVTAAEGFMPHRLMLDL